MCIYPMDSPGGYQLVGRTLPIWNTWGRVKPFTADAPWLLRIFDQVWSLRALLGSSKLVSTLAICVKGPALLSVPSDQLLHALHMLHSQPDCELNSPEFKMLRQPLHALICDGDVGAMHTKFVWLKRISQRCNVNFFCCQLP